MEGSKSNNTACLTKGQILKRDDLPKVKVDVPEWGGYVYVRTMTAGDRDEFESSFVRSKEEPDAATDPASKAIANMRNFRARLCVRTVVDESGTRLFTDDDIDALGDKSAAMVDKLYGESVKLNKIAKKDVEDLTKN